MKKVLQILLDRRLELESIEIEDDFQSLVIEARILEVETIISMLEEDSCMNCQWVKIYEEDPNLVWTNKLNNGKYARCGSPHGNGLIKVTETSICQSHWKNKK